VPAQSPASSSSIPSYVTGCNASSNAAGARNRSASPCPRNFPTAWRCGDTRNHLPGPLRARTR
jgi:hypothetical protein